MRWTIDIGYRRFPDLPLDPPEGGHEEQEEDQSDDEDEDDAPECSMCGDTYQLREGCDKTAVCDLCAQRIAGEYAPSLARACEEQRGEIERLHEDVVRLTRDRDRLAGYALAALPLCRDALTHIVEDRPEEAAQTLFRVMCALASAAKEGDDQ